MADEKKKRVAFVKNTDLLREIHKSKITFCSYLEPWHATPDAIVQSIKEITPKKIEEVRLAKSRPYGGPKVPLEDIDPHKLVWRVMTFDHIPKIEDGKKTRAAGKAKEHVKVTFPPFKHFLMLPDGPVEVCRSHWVGGFENGHFSADHGKMTPTLGRYIMLMCERFGQKPNWRGYSYIDEMVAKAMVQLSQVGLQFDEGKSNNPFAFYTTTMNNIFKRVWNEEKDQHDIRDDLIQMADMSPSNTRQNEAIVIRESAPGRVMERTPELDEWLKQKGYL